ncbi:MAG TPA: nucleoside hydrolase [Vicinamibacterales bacterium]|jgi:inosine-uridine nucleoside N-ribohydrolase|nr:nucleoside hydrolase [Vicinamibacterales bacterium]
MTYRIRFVLSLVLVLLGPAVSAQSSRMKVLLDTDIGTDIDDAWALGYALKSPSFQLLGVTVTDADTAQRARLACKLLYRLGRTDVPVAVGRPTAAVPANRIDYQFTWAEDFQAYKPLSTPAVDFLAETIRKNPGEVTLIAVGPLQNIGDLVRRYPDVIPLVKRVVLMSGSIGPNAWSSTAVAEWNVKLAIPEAQAVYAASWPLTIVPLDSTTYMRLEDQEREKLRTARTPLVVALEALLRLWSEDPTSRMTLHDQMALAEAQHPGQFFGRCERMPIRVDAGGFTRVDRTGGRSIAVCLEPKRNEFMTHYLAQLALK